MDYFDNVFVLGGAEEFVKRDQISFQRSCYRTWVCSLFHKLFIQKDKWNGSHYLMVYNGVGERVWKMWYF